MYCSCHSESINGRWSGENRGTMHVDFEEKKPTRYIGENGKSVDRGHLIGAQL